MTISFTDTLQQLFTHLGLTYPEEVGIETYPALVLDEHMVIHFLQREDRVEIVTSLGGLPDQVSALSKLLSFNYSEAAYPICFASDSEGNDLLAIIRLPVDSSYEVLLAALHSLILQIEDNQAEIAASVIPENIAEKFKRAF
jgi:hypothetical protein